MCVYTYTYIHHSQHLAGPGCRGLRAGALRDVRGLREFR